MRSGKIVESVKEGNPSSHLLSVLAKPHALSGKGSKCMTKGEVYPFNEAGADRETKLFESCCPAKNSLGQGLESSFLLFLNDLPVDQVRMGLQDRIFGTTPSAGWGKAYQLVVDCNESRQIGAKYPSICFLTFWKLHPTRSC